MTTRPIEDLRKIENKDSERAAVQQPDGGNAVEAVQKHPLATVEWRRYVRIIGIIALLALIAVQLWRVASYDFRDGPVVGDLASSLLQTISIADGANLSYDLSDIEAFEELGWGPPRGLYFQQVDNGFAFAKPYGYSLWLSPWVKIFGAVSGVAVGNAMLLLVITALAYAILRRRFDRLLSLAAATVFVFGSSAYVYGYVLQTDLFLAMLTAIAMFAALKLFDEPRLVWAVLLGATAGFAVTEKLPLLAIYAFFSAVVFWKHKSEIRIRIAAAVSFAIAWVIGAFPYLYYSSFRSWNPYSGDRFYTNSGDVPFDATPLTNGGTTVSTEKFFSPSYWAEVLGDEKAEIAQSAMYYFIGRHTGLLVFMPLAFVIVIVVLWRRRSEWNLAAASVMLGLGVYMAFYVVLFPFNSFGGGATFGNRYLLQVIPAVLLAPVLLDISPKKLWKMTATGAVLSLLFLGPSHRDPDRAFWLLARTSVAQELLPFEYDRVDDLVFACGTYDRNVIIRTGDALCYEIYGITVVRTEAP